MIPKFRAFWKSEKKMITDISWMRFDKEDLIGRIDGQTILPIGFSKVILMQSTGLFDKNGVEIYEGDVVRWGMLPNSFEIHHRYAVVERNPDIQFRILYYIDSRTGEKRMGDNYVFHFGSFIYRNTEDCLEIISNIHENPHLVEVGHD